MQVKSAELKTHLSHYLRLVQETGEDIEVCVRETPVAYLTRTKEAPMNTAQQLETRQLEAAFQTVGLTLAAPVALPSTTRRMPTLPWLGMAALTWTAPRKCVTNGTGNHSPRCTFF